MGPCHQDKYFCEIAHSLFFVGKILLLQREIPDNVNAIAAKVAKEAGTLVILDMGGRDEPLSRDLLQYIDIISPNEVSLLPGFSDH